MFVAIAEFPFDETETTRDFYEFAEMHIVPAVQSLNDELLYARTTHKLELPRVGIAAVYTFDGISLRCSVRYEPLKDKRVARFEVAYCC